MSWLQMHQGQLPTSWSLMLNGFEINLLQLLAYSNKKTLEHRHH